jgi:hypothetical protein
VNAYLWIPVPLWFMEHARHRCRGGRSRSERFLDRRGMGVRQDLEFELRAPFKKSIYPARATNADLIRMAREDNACMNCSASLKDRRRGAQFCSDACKKRFWRALVPDKCVGSLRVRGKEKVKIRKRALKNWCPGCQKYQLQNHPQPCKPARNA